MSGYSDNLQETNWVCKRAPREVKDRLTLYVMRIHYTEMP